MRPSTRRTGSAHHLTPALALLFALVVGTPAHATGEGEDCGEKSTTPDIVACIDQRVVEWERVLAEAAATSSQAGSPEYASALEKAQSLWFQFRDANCLTYRLGEGTIAAVEAAECRLRMTKERAAELGAEVPD
jgi:uncharacterized protein YecT (DUF1311 family)